MSPELIYEAMRHLVDEVIYVNDVERNIVFVTPSVEHVLGFSEAEFSSFRTTELIHPADLPLATAAAAELRSGPGGTYRVTLRVRHADGSWVWCEILGRNLLDQSIAGIVNTLRDVSERRALEEDLLRQATHDDLTGLRNRRGFLADLNAALADGRDPHLGLLMIDLDGFKQVNDAFGHPAGDRVLQAVAERLVAALRPGDVAARLGGDEFAVLCRRLTSPDMLETIAARICDATAGVHEFGIEGLDQASARVGLSVGAVVAKPGDDPGLLLSQADAALYAVKAAGGGGVRLRRW